jgi:MYXO-CTERM domain-containing protein
MRRFAIALACVFVTYASSASAIIAPVQVCAKGDADGGDCDGGVDASDPDSGVATDAATPVADASGDGSVRQDTTPSDAEAPPSSYDAGPPLRFEPVRIPTASPTADDEACSAGATRSPWSTLTAFGITVLALARLRRKRR